ncbi:MAG TPA: hypothetical protein VGF95_08080 [Solirubrobacteraceae bacterium]
MLKATTLSIAACVVLCALWAAMPGKAAAAGPQFSIYSSTPDTIQAGEPVYIAFAIRNVGDTRSTGPIVIQDTVSPGMKPEGLFPGFESFVTSVEYPEIPEEGFHEGSCKSTGLTMTCTVQDALPPGAQLGMRLMAEVEAGASGLLENTIAVSAGNVAPVTSAQELNVGGLPTFGLDRFGTEILDAEGEPLTQAATDPADFTTTLRFKSTTGKLFGQLPMNVSVEHFKNVTVHLPAGLIGNPTATPVRCTAAQLNETRGPGRESIPRCPDNSQVGVADVELGGATYLSGLYNVTPPAGAASELGFEVLGTVVPLDAYVRPGDDGIDIVSRNTSTTVPITEASVTVWGDPASPSHDRLRGECLGRADGADGLECPSTAPEEAFLRLPTSCSGSGIRFAAGSNSYEKPDSEVTASSTGPVLTGCENVPFNPSIYVQPTTSAASSTSGVAVQLSVPQSSNPESVAEADLKKAVVTLPEGMTINPSSADGLQACSDAQLRLGLEGPTECPEASKIGRVELRTPLLENMIEGSIWLRTQNSSDPASGEMFRIALELRDDQHGIDIKVPGHVAANPLTGQLTTTFDDNPQLPFETITLHFKAGARSPLSTPATCGTKSTVAELSSWAQPDAPVQRTIPFEITSGAEGSACAAILPFQPSFNAGVTSVQAGGFTPFLTTFVRKDADQSMQRVSVKLPLGLTGSLTGLPLCPEAQASAGTCSQASEIGTVTAGAGVGPTPFYVTGGKVFMTGPYEGAPFGLSIVVPAKAGPFDLGNVNVRARVELDPQTAQLTVTSDPLPQIVGGVPVDLRLVNVTIDRPGFTFNPTDCEPLSVTGTMTGGQGAVAHLESHFQVTNCGALEFQPAFTASTSGKTSRANGASLSVHLAYPKEPIGKDANIKEVKVELPKALPSRLSTLQKACTLAQFDANPAGCPADAVVGHAKALTPILPVPLEGPAYFVSNGGQKFPELVLVLQGYGVTIDLHGETFISKSGITSSTFETVPDQPVESFELTLPAGPNSALAANRNLCNAPLTMPTRFVGQNGKVLAQKTQIKVTGCPNALSISSHRVKQRTLMLQVYVPSAGELEVSGRGLQTKTARAAARQLVTVKVHERKPRALNTKANVVFTPSAGKSRKRQARSVSVQFKAPKARR